MSGNKEAEEDARQALSSDPFCKCCYLQHLVSYPWHGGGAWAAVLSVVVEQNHRKDEGTRSINFLIWSNVT